jgi:hypothetical protein
MCMVRMSNTYVRSVSGVHKNKDKLQHCYLHRVLQTGLHLCPNKLQVSHAVTPEDRLAPRGCVRTILATLHSYNKFMTKNVFYDKTVVHV